MNTSTLDLRKHPFVLASLILLLRTGRLRSLKHPKHGLAIIVDETARLRCILLADSDPLEFLWIRRTGRAQRSQNKADKKQSFWTRRLENSLGLPFPPEPRPHGAVTIKIESARLTFKELQSLIDCGFPVSGLLAFMGLQSPCDRRSTKGGNGSLTQYRHRSFVHPDQSYVPSGTKQGLGPPVRRTTQDQSRVGEERFNRLIQDVRYDLPMTSALREVCVLGFRPKDAAQKYGISVDRLKKAAYRLRCRAHGSYVKPVFSEQVSLVCA
jgi:hypothetical protein